MKSEERHKLLTNDLGVATTKTVGFFERHLEAVISIAVAVLILGAVGFWWTLSADSASTEGWTLLDSAKNLDDLGNVADKFKGKAPGQWALLKVSERNAQDAIPMMFTNRELAKSGLKSAREGFETLVQDRAASPVIRERSLLGLARCLESICDGDTSKAVDAYERLLTEFPDSIYKPIASERITALKKNDAKEFYAWFSSENPKPTETLPEDFKAGGMNLPSSKFGSDDFDMGDVDPGKSSKLEVPATTTDKPQGDAIPEKSPEAVKVEEPAKPAEGDNAPAADTPKNGEKLPETK